MKANKHVTPYLLHLIQVFVEKASQVTPYTGADPGKNFTGLLESERQIYGSPEANVFRFSLTKIIFPSILSHLENLTDFRKTVWFRAW